MQIFRIAIFAASIFRAQICVGAMEGNVKWSLSETILDGADTSDSLFSHDLAQQTYFDEHPDDLAIARRISGDYWANSILHVERLLQADRGAGGSMRIARAVFDNTKDASVRTNLLLFMGIAIDSTDEHKAFIYNTLARFPNDLSVTLSAIRALSSFYSSHKDTFNWLITFLKHPNPLVTRSAFGGIARSNKFKDGLPMITPYILRCNDSSQRRAYVGRIASLLGQTYQKAAYNYTEKKYFDFKESIPESALRSWNDEDFYHFRLENYKLNLEASLNVYRARRINQLTRVGRTYGITFMLEEKLGKQTKLIPLGAPLPDMGATAETNSLVASDN